MFNFSEETQEALIELLISELDYICEINQNGKLDYLRIPYEKALAELIGDCAPS